jgi:hypothetical protein
MSMATRTGSKRGSARAPIFRIPDFSTLITAPDDETAAAAFKWYLVLTPILWALGLLAPMGLLLVLWLLAWRWPTDGLANAVASVWLLVAACQVAAVIWNWSLAGESLAALPRRLVAFSIIGWLFLGVIMAVGYAYDLAKPALVRAIMVLGLYIALFTAASLPLAMVLGLEELHFNTPMRMILGDSPSADFYASAMVFHREATLGLDLPRMVLFYPWPTALGLSGIAIFLIAFCEEHRWWRFAGYAGGLSAAVFSLSRAAWVALPVAWLVLLCLRAKPVTRSLMVVCASLIGLGVVIADINPVALMKGASTSFAEARSGSSMARDLIYEHSWKGFLSSPVFGKGWIGPSILAEETLPIGSHSSVYGTLYTGGALTFGSLILAGIVTLSALLIRAAQGSPPAAAGFAVLCSLTLFAYGESLFSLVLPCMFIFLFAGGALRKDAIPGQAVRKVVWNPR